MSPIISPNCLARSLFQVQANAVEAGKPMEPTPVKLLFSEAGPSASVSWILPTDFRAWSAVATIGDEVVHIVEGELVEQLVPIGVVIVLAVHIGQLQTVLGTGGRHLVGIRCRTSSDRSSSCCRRFALALSDILKLVGAAVASLHSSRSGRRGTGTSRRPPHHRTGSSATVLSPLWVFESES